MKKNHILYWTYEIGKVIFSQNSQLELSFSRKLLSIADKFMSSGNGASCRVEGLSNTDKVHLQRRLAERCRHRAEIVTVNYDELFTDSNCEERFEKDRVGLRSEDLICQTLIAEIESNCDPELFRTTPVCSSCSMPSTSSRPFVKPFSTNCSMERCSIRGLSSLQSTVR